MRHAAQILPASILLILLNAPATTGLLGQARALAPGEEVRITWLDPGVSYTYVGPHRTTAEVVDFDGTTLMLRRGKRMLTVPVSSIRGLERRVGTRPASAPAMVAGSATGFAAGFALGFATGGIEGGGADVDRVDAGLTTGVLIGAPLGALIAWAMSRSRGIYEDVPFGDVVAGIIADPAGRVGIAVRTPNR
jgi:hypothetical protein